MLSKFFDILHKSSKKDQCAHYRQREVFEIFKENFFLIDNKSIDIDRKHALTLSSPMIYL